MRAGHPKAEGRVRSKATSSRHVSNEVPAMPTLIHRTQAVEGVKDQIHNTIFSYWKFVCVCVFMSSWLKSKACVDGLRIDFMKFEPTFSYILTYVPRHIPQGTADFTTATEDLHKVPVLTTRWIYYSLGSRWISEKKPFTIPNILWNI